MTRSAVTEKGVPRRSVLASVVAGLATTSGCLSRVRAMAGREESSTVSLSIKTLPVDEDPFAIAIARQLLEWFEAAGIRTSIQPMTAEELYRQVLLNHDFDMFVCQYPTATDRPDALYPLLHSTFAVEPGLQNPFGYTNLSMDELLSTQRRTAGSERAEAVATIQRRLVEACPFTVVGFPETIRATGTERFAGWDSVFDPSPLSLLSLTPADASVTTLRATTPDNRPMTNLNPLMATFRGYPDLTELVYDPLARRYRGGITPWAAEDWEWRGSDPLEIQVRLREDLTWHDGERLTAADVAFTYQLLRDTSLGTLDDAAPSLRFRGRSTLVERAVAVDDRTVRLQFTDCTPEVADRALTVPLLPAHVWRERTSRADVSGFEVGAPTTEALVTNAVSPVGSGPLAFESSSQRDRLVLARFADHFLERGEATVPDALADGVPFEQFELQFVASDSSAVQLVADGEADVTALGVGPDLVSRMVDDDAVAPSVDRSHACYLAGFNARRSPLSNPRFRSLLSQLMDRAALADSVFGGYFQPAYSLLAGTDWLPSPLAWASSEPVVEFLGSDGRVDPERARGAFRSAGYRYDERGRLLRS